MAQWHGRITRSLNLEKCWIRWLTEYLLCQLLFIACSNWKNGFSWLLLFLNFWRDWFPYFTGQKKALSQIFLEKLKWLYSQWSSWQYYFSGLPYQEFLPSYYG